MSTPRHQAPITTEESSQLLDDLLLLAMTDPDLLEGQAPRRPAGPPHKSGRKPDLPGFDEVKTRASSHEEVQALLARVSTRAEQCELFGGLQPTREDVLLVAHLAQSTVDDDGCEGVQHLTALFGLDGRSTLTLAGRVRQLVKHRVLSVRRNHPGARTDNLSLVSLLHSHVRLSERSLNLIFAEPSDDLELASREDASFDLLEEAFQLVHPLRKLMPVGPFQRRDQGPRRAVLLTAFGAHWASLTQRAADAGQSFPLGDLAAEAGLDEAETAVLVYLVEETVNGMNCSASELSTLVAGSGLERLNMHLLKPDARLVEQNVVSLDDAPFGHASVKLSQWSIARLTGTVNPDTRSRLKDLLAEQDLLVLAEPGPGWEHLALEPNMHALLENLAAGLEGGAAQKLAEWGLPVKGRAQGRVLMFSGPSGTGKTLTARALATRLRLPVLATDSARLISKWAGDSQKNVAEIFRVYAKACKVLGTRPILLLDEADQVLGTRQAGGEAVDRMYSQMQNIFLEALDAFDGLLVATTNLPEALDPAFMRRFDAKLTFARPCSAVRRRIWDLHLPAGVPRLDELDLDDLSGYDMTGGQIAVAARSAIERAALRGDGLCHADVEDAIQGELKGTAGCVGRGSFGFGRQ
jgi:hypothetical protein